MNLKLLSRLKSKKTPPVSANACLLASSNLKRTIRARTQVHRSLLLAADGPGFYSQFERRGSILLPPRPTSALSLRSTCIAQVAPATTPPPPPLPPKVPGEPLYKMPQSFVKCYFEWYSANQIPGLVRTVRSKSCLL